MFRARRIKRRGVIAAKRANTGRQEQVQAVDEAPPPSPALPIKELAELREQGILTDEEYVAEQKKLLGI